MNSCLHQYIDDRLAFSKKRQASFDVVDSHFWKEDTIQKTLGGVLMALSKGKSAEAKEKLNSQMPTDTTYPDLGIVISFEKLSIRATTTNPELIGKKILILHPEDTDTTEPCDFCAIKDTDGTTHFIPGFIIETLKSDFLLGEAGPLTPNEEKDLLTGIIKSENPPLLCTQDDTLNINSAAPYPFIPESGIPLI